MQPYIYKITDKLQYKDLLLLADEQWEMVEKYLQNSTMYILDDNGVKGEITVLDLGNGVLEIKNLAILAPYQHCGYGQRLVEYVCQKYKDSFLQIQVGTGDSPLTLPFYEKCGFKKSHSIKNFFTNNYDHPIIENGKLLTDTIMFTKNLKK